MVTVHAGVTDHTLPFTMSACNSRTTLILRDSVRAVDISKMQTIFDTLGPLQSGSTWFFSKTEKVERA